MAKCSRNDIEKRVGVQVALKQAVTRIDEEQYDQFRAITHELGTTPSDALRMFIYAFNEYRGFPYAVRVQHPVVEPVKTEAEATRLSTALSMEAINEAW